MSDASLSESTVEDAALAWLEAIGWRVAHGPDIAPDAANAQRADYGEVVLNGRLQSALAQLNPDLPAAALDDASRRLTRPAGATLETSNRDFHRMVVAGVTVEYVDTDGRVRGDQVRVLDFDEPEANDWLAVNQFTVIEHKHERRPDIVLFVNGLPLGVIELKHPTDENATIRSAFQQLQTYKAAIPLAVRVQRGACRVGRARGAHRRADRPVGVVQAVADDHGRDGRRLDAAAAAGPGRGHLRAGPAAGPGPRLHRVRGRRQRRARQEDGGLPPVPRGGDRGRRDVARGSGAAGRGRATRAARPRHAWPAARRCAG